MYSTPTPTSNELVRGRCACGRRYRIRNAVDGVTVNCPACGRAITITDADLRAAAADAALIPLQADDVPAREAILLDYGELRLAPEDSRPGLTGRQAPPHDEAMVNSALSGRTSMRLTHEDLHPGPDSTPNLIYVEFETVPRTFVWDLLASFWFAGSPRNAINILLTSVACMLPAFLHALVPGPFGLLFLVLDVIVLMYVVQFYWSVLDLTAGGEDQIPWVQSNWTFWEDALRPAFWIAFTSAFCSTPYWLVNWLMARATFPVPPWFPWAALAAGWFAWPVGIMSIGLGRSIVFLRPDWLVRCIIGIGPLYLVAWGIAVVTVAAWIVTLFGGMYYRLPAWAEFLNVLIGVPLSLYFGYALFRTFGLLFRHFRERFPWRF